MQSWKLKSRIFPTKRKTHLRKCGNFIHEEQAQITQKNTAIILTNIQLVQTEQTLL